MDLWLLARVIVEGRVINLVLVNGSMGILKSSWVLIVSKEDPW
jgi:hypothetical protein